MEASSPKSVPAKPKAPAPVAGAFSPFAPSVLLPMRFMAIGLLSLFVAVGLLIARPDILATYHYNQYVIAVTHLIVLGWISTIVFGAMYQLVPVALETRLYSERLARWQFVLHAIGFTGMVYMFWTWNMRQVGHFGSVLAAGVVLFLYNLTRTLLRVPRWNVVATGVACALSWLGLTITAGLSIAIGKCSYGSLDSSASPVSLLWFARQLQTIAGYVTHFDAIGAMHAHAHLGAVGIFLILIVAISYKLLPMFTLSEVQSARRAVVALVLINLGLAGSFFTILLKSPLKLATASLLIVGLAVYAMEVRAILRARKRRSLDWGIKTFLAGLGFLVPVCGLGMVLSWPSLPLTIFTGQLENAYGFLGFLGVFALCIIGMLYKILPFLIWYSSYSRQIGAAKVPSLNDLYSATVQKIGFFLYLGGLGVSTAGILLSHGLLVRSGTVLLAASLATLAVNVGKMARHLLHPQVEPLVYQRPLSAKVA